LSGTLTYIDCGLTFPQFSPPNVITTSSRVRLPITPLLWPDISLARPSRSSRRTAILAIRSSLLQGTRSCLTIRLTRTHFWVHAARIIATQVVWIMVKVADRYSHGDRVSVSNNRRRRLRPRCPLARALHHSDLSVKMFMAAVGEQYRSNGLPVRFIFHSSLFFAIYPPACLPVYNTTRILLLYCIL